MHAFLPARRRPKRKEKQNGHRTAIDPYTTFSSYKRTAATHGCLRVSVVAGSSEEEAQMDLAPFYCRRRQRFRASSFFRSTWFVFTSFPVSARRSVPSYIPRASYYDTLKLPSFFYHFFFLLYRPRCRPKEQLDQVRRPRRAKNVQRPVCLRGACRCRAALMFPHARSQILGQPLCRSVIFKGELQFMRVSADKLPHRSICQRSP